MVVSDGFIREAVFIKGDSSLVDARKPPIEGSGDRIIGELGFVLKSFLFSKDIQDEKIFGTCHVATGRSEITWAETLLPISLLSRLNASHDDILFAPQDS